MDHLLRTNLYDVNGRVALVTGGGTGIGLMITQTLAANGAKVYIGSRRGEKVGAAAKEVSPQVSGQVVPIELDVTDKASIKNAVRTISENDGKLDILVNNAGITGPVSMFFNDDSAPENKSPEALGNALFENEKVEDWMGLYGNNVASIFFVTTAFLGLLSKASEARGAWSAGVINISSMSGQLRISENKFAYNSAKTANIQLTKMLATEFALKNIPVRVNAIAPGVYPSEMTGEQGSHTLPEKEASEIAQGLRPIPLQRSGNDIDMGGLALFLASPAGYYVHGQVITTDGGFTAVHPAVSHEMNHLDKLEARQSEGSNLQRSRNGCLTCRRKHKKCDEKMPLCSRCEKSNSQCTWPRSPHSGHPLPPAFEAPLDEHITAAPSFLAHPAGFGTNDIDSMGSLYDDPLARPVSLLPTGKVPPVVDARLVTTKATWNSDSGSTQCPASNHAGSSRSMSTTDHDGFLMPLSPPSLTNSGGLTLRNWEYAQDYGPRIIWPPDDSEDGHDFDPEGVMPAVRKSIDFLNRTVVIEPVFQEIFHFFSTFLSRIFYDYATIPESIVGWMLQRFEMSNSAKYGMLATAILFRANYESSPSTNALRSHASELHSLACQQILLDLKDDKLLPQAKLAGLIEITNYEYYSSSLSRYYPHILEEASVVRHILGSDTIDLFNLSGKHTFDIRCFAWCDILNSMATSRPTLLKYESKIEQAQRLNSEDGYANPDRGVEWIYGCPDVLAVLLARITTLKHSPESKEEKVSRGVGLEQLVLNWEFRPIRAKGSVMRVARVGVQEMWRHAAILYLHQAIFRSDPLHPTVRNSVRNIFHTSLQGHLRSLRRTGRFTTWSDKEPPYHYFLDKFF
ncbi:hypothetical protein OPQ81_001289 [Rhizoctonia solani]|nr:hypothetical protein OPQ81_001289 [Rhizoctonia solani]